MHRIHEERDVNKINDAILHRLTANSRATWQSIGRELGLTGQAVAARVQQLEDRGLIRGYTLKRGGLQRFFVTVFLDHPRFDELERLLDSDQRVESADKVAGEGCYHLVVALEAEESLASFLTQLEKFGRCKVLSSLRRLK